MKRLLLFFPLVAILNLSCTTNNIAGSSLSPVITGFSPDTVWTFQNLTIHGKNFGYDRAGVLVWIDTTLLYPFSTVEDTVLIVQVPENARSGFIRVWAYEQTATSAKRVVIIDTIKSDTINSIS